MDISSYHRKIFTDLRGVVSNLVGNLKESKLIVVILIYLNFLSDNILLTMVVPIIPDYLAKVDDTSINELSRIPNIPWTRSPGFTELSKNGTVFTQLYKSNESTMSQANANHIDKRITIKSVERGDESYRIPSPLRSHVKENANKSANILIKNQTDWTGSESESRINKEDDWINKPLGELEKFHGNLMEEKLVNRNNISDQSEKRSKILQITAKKDKANEYNESNRVGMLFAAKAVSQLLFNPVSRKLIRCYGHNLTQIMASSILLTSTLFYAFGKNFISLFIARSFHGIGSSMITISGMTKIANLFQNEKERCQALGISFGGIAAGVLIGYPFGGFAYDFFGKQLPFLLLGFLISLLIGFQLMFQKSNIEMKDDIENVNLTQLVGDLDIMMCIGAIFFTTSITAVLEPALPIYLIESLGTPEWQLGTVFLPDSLGYIIGTHFIGFNGHSFPKWNLTVFCLFLAGFTTISVPLTTHIYQLIVPQFLSGLSIGATDAAMSTQLASLADCRYLANYASIYSLSSTVVCLAYIIGPLVSGLVFSSAGFTGLIHFLGTLVILYGLTCVSYLVYLNEKRKRPWFETIPILSHNHYETLNNT